MRHSDSGECWSELHLQSLGELLSGIIKDRAADGADLKEFAEKIVTLRELFRTIRDENDEIARVTGIDRMKLRTERFVKIGHAGPKGEMT